MRPPADRPFRDRAFLRPLTIKFRDRDQREPEAGHNPMVAPATGDPGVFRPSDPEGAGPGKRRPENYRPENPGPEGGEPSVRPLPADMGGQAGRGTRAGARDGGRPPGSASQRIMTGPGRIALGRAWQLTDSAGVMARNHPLEIAAILALGVGGAIYPPVWLIGAGLALASKSWDLIDKWAGIAGPVMLEIFGTVGVLVAGGGKNSLTDYLNEAWLGADRIARLAAILGAAYLLWRIFRGPKEPKQPPWNRSHRLG